MHHAIEVERPHHAVQVGFQLPGSSTRAKVGSLVGHTFRIGHCRPAFPRKPTLPEPNISDLTITHLYASCSDMADVQVFGSTPQPERPRKRRRRTMACTQCRSRKMRCDREYPTCSRCLKNKTPTKCIYEDGFLWQQPATVPTAAFTSDRGSTISMPRTDQTPIQTPPHSGLAPASTRSEALLSTTAAGPGSTPFEGPHHHHGGRPHVRERGFLETVLGAPKAAINQEPYVNTGVLQRPKRALPEPEMPLESQVGHGGVDLDDSDDPLSPSQQLDLSPRIMMRGRETKTRFSGSGVYANLVAQVCCSLELLSRLILIIVLVPRYQILRGGNQIVKPHSLEGPT